VAGQGEQQAPREILAKAIADGFMTPDERARFNSQRAREMAKAEARRAAPSPQVEMELAA
jgi:hypothetical protein